MLDTKTIYDQIQPELRAAEDLRLIALNKHKKALLIIIPTTITAIATVFTLTESIRGPIVFSIVSLFIALIIYVLLTYKTREAFISTFKNNIISAIVTSIEPKAEYKPEQGIPEQAFKKTGHYKRKIDRYHSEDLFIAHRGDTLINFAEIKAEYKTNSSDSSPSWHTIFMGIMFTADFHKEFNTWVTIKPDNESIPFIGKLSRTAQKMSSTNIRMEDPEFEKHFKVNAGDDQQARYLLTPDMQARILSLRSTYGSKIILSLRDSNICITIPKEHDYFEPKMKQSVFDRNQIERIASEISYFFNLVEAMNLNTRIWTKE